MKGIEAKGWRVVYKTRMEVPRWGASVKCGVEMLGEGGKTKKGVNVKGGGECQGKWKCRSGKYKRG